MQLIDTFSGIGGFSLAGRWMGWNTVQFCEIDPFCKRILKKHWEGVLIHDDIKTLTYDQIKQNGLYSESEPTMLVGGFPCQPFSHAGQRRGEEDDRYLWPSLIRLVREGKPDWCCFENVAGLISMEDGKTLEGIFTDLEGEGYTVESFIIPACGVGAWHRRDRVWIIGYLPERINANSPCTNPHSIGSHRQEEQQQGKAELRDKQISGTEGLGKDVSDTDNKRLRDTQPKQDKQNRERGEWCGNTTTGGSPKARGCWSAQPRLGRMVNGLSTWLDEPDIPRVATGVKNRTGRLKGLGNAIVPQVAFEIFKAIEQLNNQQYG